MTAIEDGYVVLMQQPEPHQNWLTYGSNVSTLEPYFLVSGYIISLLFMAWKTLFKIKAAKG